ncbi:MAG: hypothetical protein SVZ03_05945 [Spirochaetota bacterium]|nr:hypothetical protein [Spirochaetota bacterium]
MRIDIVMCSLILSVFLVFFCHNNFIIASNNSNKTLEREMDCVVLTGDQCSEILGKPISRYGLYSLQNGSFVSIPFQIDELDEKDQFILTQGKGKSVDKDNSHFDANDQLVFMARDTGDKIMREMDLPKTATGIVEITIIDPTNEKKGWVYLMNFDNPPRPSDIDYVNYDPAKMKIVAWNYITRFNKENPVAASKYAFWEKIGGGGSDLIDRVKVRIVLKKFFTLHRSEEDIKVKEIGYIDGPVRVIVHSENKTPLVFGISASKTKQNTLYYYSYASFPFVVDLPILPSKFHVHIYDDFADCMGCTFYSSTNPKGHIIDGVMDDSDKKLDLSPFQWFVLSNEELAFWSRCIYPSNSPVKAFLYFKDDKNVKDSMEEVTGELPGIGFDFRSGWDKVKEFPIEFRLVHFFTKTYNPGDEKKIVNIHDHPLRITVEMKK